MPVAPLNVAFFRKYSFRISLIWPISYGLPPTTFLVLQTILPGKCFQNIVIIFSLILWASLTGAKTLEAELDPLLNLMHFGESVSSSTENPGKTRFQDCRQIIVNLFSLIFLPMK